MDKTYYRLEPITDGGAICIKSYTINGPCGERYTTTEIERKDYIAYMYRLWAKDDLDIDTLDEDDKWSVIRYASQRENHAQYMQTIKLRLGFAS